MNNIKGCRPPEPLKYNPNNPDKPKEPYIISSYKHSLDLTKLFLNRYEIKCKFYNNYTLHIDMDVFDKKNNQIETNVFNNNTWVIVRDGYKINFDPKLLNKVKHSPAPCNLDNHIKYISGSPNKIVFSLSVKVLVSVKLYEEIEQCNDINC